MNITPDGFRALNDAGPVAESSTVTAETETAQ